MASLKPNTCITSLAFQCPKVRLLIHNGHPCPNNPHVMIAGQHSSSGRTWHVCTPFNRHVFLLDDSTTIITDADRETEDGANDRIASFLAIGGSCWSGSGQPLTGARCTVFPRWPPDEEGHPNGPCCNADADYLCMWNVLAGREPLHNKGVCTNTFAVRKMLLLYRWSNIMAWCVYLAVTCAQFFAARAGTAKQSACFNVLLPPCVTYAPPTIT